MSNGEQINSELEFQERFGRMKPEEKEYWMAKELFFQSITMQKLSCTQDTISIRVQAIENNCNQKFCEPEITNVKYPSRIKYVAYGGGISAGVIGVIYGIIELIKVWRT